MNENVEEAMTPILLEDLGMRYPTERSKQRYRYGLYQCQYCGKEFETMVASIKNGNTTSCGCLAKKGNNTSHGLAQHRLYNTWLGMKHRCYNINNDYYKDYGERGIKVCDRWLDVENFIEDMYPTFEEGLSLDRIDVNGNYEPDNCRWTTQTIQMQNTRDICKSNTSGYRGVCWHKKSNKWVVRIMVNTKYLHLGYYTTALEAAKAYERYIRLNKLEHNFTPALTEDEIKEINKEIEGDRGFEVFK